MCKQCFFMVMSVVSQNKHEVLSSNGNNFPLDILLSVVNVQAR